MPPAAASDPSVPVTVGVPTERMPGEARVALVPAVVPLLTKMGLPVVVEAGAGSAAGFRDADYVDKGAMIGSRDEVFAAGVVVCVQTFGADPNEGRADLVRMRAGQLVIGFADPLGNPEGVVTMAGTGAAVFAVELVPRITRAQSMDALSSQATVSGYKAVLVAAGLTSKMFPMLTTAAGTVRPAKVFVVGAGVAGLQAIATARRLGAVVEAYDIRPAAREQVQSVGAKFVELDLADVAAEDGGGYAREMDEAFLARQRDLMARVVAGSDVVITTAAVPGKRSAVLVTAAMVAGMQPGAVIVDLAAERGGNCELTQPGETVHAHGVTICGPTNLAATVPFHASSLYAKNVVSLLTHLLEDGRPAWDMDDEITRETLVARDGEVVQPRVRELLGLVAADVSPGVETDKQRSTAT